MKNLQIKICGMKYPENIQEIQLIGVDYLGFIFYPLSERFIENPPSFPISSSVQKVGVFVNENEEKIKELAEKFDLSVIQLHGNESPELCAKLRLAGFQVWKSVGMDDSFEYKSIEMYKDCVDSFLLDTKSANYGGTGQKFNWTLLESYPYDLPFWLSGGIGKNELEEIHSLSIPQLRGVDLNSKFEKEPGLKDVELLKECIENFRKNEQIYR